MLDWIGGAKFLVKNGETGLTGNIYTGLNEFPDMAFLLHLLRPEDTFVDVGANVGSYTILAGSVVGSTSYAFEPVPHTFAKLAENIRINQMEDRVTAFNIGLSKSEGRIRFTGHLDTVNHAIAEHEDPLHTIEVDVKSLDQALGGARPHLMKIDVEGYETPVLEGAIETLRHPNLLAIIMEINGCGQRYGYDDSKLLDTLSDFGFKPYAYDPLCRDLQNLQGRNQMQGNTIFVRNEALVRERIQSAPRFEVLGVSI